MVLNDSNRSNWKSHNLQSKCDRKVAERLELAPEWYHILKKCVLRFSPSLGPLVKCCLRENGPEKSERVEFARLICPKEFFGLYLVHWIGYDNRG